VKSDLRTGKAPLATDCVALFVDSRGPYPELVAEWYDEARDARTYAGNRPVVAHPPCGPWSRMRHLSRETTKDLATWAVDLVRRVGGVLEHPAGSALFEHMGMPRPYDDFRADAHGGVTFEVEQVDWGHPARKRTWLYAVGVRVAPLNPPKRQPTHWASGGRTRSSRQGAPVPLGIKVCSAQQRRRTPRAFAEMLIAMARSVGLRSAA
jgi:hypothetical protein